MSFGVCWSIFWCAGITEGHIKEPWNYKHCHIQNTGQQQSSNILRCKMKVLVMYATPSHCQTSLQALLLFLKINFNLTKQITPPSTQAFSSRSLDSTWCKMSWRHRMRLIWWRHANSRQVVWARRDRLCTTLKLNHVSTYKRIRYRCYFHCCSSLLK